MNQKHSIRKVIVSMFTFAVAFVTLFMLTVPAFSEEAETFCGKKEHKHSKSCYTTELTCGQEESEGHTHTDACYQTETVTTLVCGLEETPDQEAVYDEEGNLVSEAVPGHTHTDACYQTETVTTLVCGQEESEGHKHSDECYTKKLTCGKKEHKHSDECYSDKNADVESAADWEATLPKELTGVWADDVISVAESQLGYTESKRNFIKGEGRNFGYSRYGAWYGNAYGDWCAMFVSFCLNYADIPAKYVPRDAYCPNWVSTLKAKKMYGPAHGEDAYVPVKGDIIFFDWEGDGTVDHVGLVAEVKDVDGKTQIKTIEGNSGDMVQYCHYSVDSGDIVGYGKLPKNPEDPKEKAKAEEEKAKAAEEEAAEEAKAEEQKVQEAEEARVAVDVAVEASADAVKSSATLMGQGYAKGETDAQIRYQDAQYASTYYVDEPVVVEKEPVVQPEDVESDAQRVTIAGKWTNLVGFKSAE